MKPLIKILRRFLRNFKVLRSQGVGVLQSFNAAMKVAFLESTSAVGRLAYKKADILMELGTHRQIRRLSGCIKEPEMAAWLEENFKKGNVFYNIGANVGAFSLVAWEIAGRDCKIYSFEPSFSNFFALSRNIFLNNASEKITPFQIALSDKTALSQLHYSGLSIGEAQHKWGVGEGSSNKASQMVPSFRLDDFIKIFEIAAPNLIKIDVDGYEFDVIAGAAQILRNSALRSMIIEIDETIPKNKDIYKTIEDAGFSMTAKRERGAPATFSCVFERN